VADGQPRRRYIRRGFLTPTERIRYEARASKWFFFVAPLFVFVLLAAGDYWFLSALGWVPGVTSASSYLAGILSGPGVGGVSRAVLGGGVVALLNLVFVLWVFARYLSWARYSYAVTSERLIKQHARLTLLGWVYDDREISVRQVRDVDVFQDRVSWKLLGVGTLNVHSLSEVGRPDTPGNPGAAEAEGRPYRDPLVRGGKSIDQYPGVEWWFAIPSPIRAQREIEQSNEAIERGGRTD